MAKQTHPSPLMDRAEVLLAIGLPKEALILWRQMAGTGEESLRFRALQLRLFTACGQWPQGMAAAAQIKSTDPLRLRKAGGRFFLSWMQEEIRRENPVMAQHRCTQAKNLWPEGNVDHLSSGLPPPLPLTSSRVNEAPETYQIERFIPHRKLASAPHAGTGFQSISTPLLKLRCFQQRRRGSQRQAIWFNQLAERWPQIGRLFYGYFGMYRTWGILANARLRSWWRLSEWKVLRAFSSGKIIASPVATPPFVQLHQILAGPGDHPLQKGRPSMGWQRANDRPD